MFRSVNLNFGEDKVLLSSKKQLVFHKKRHENLLSDNGEAMRIYFILKKDILFTKNIKIQSRI